MGFVGIYESLGYSGNTMPPSDTDSFFEKPSIPDAASDPHEPNRMDEHPLPAVPNSSTMVMTATELKDWASKSAVSKEPGPVSDQKIRDKTPLEGMEPDASVPVLPATGEVEPSGAPSSTAQLLQKQGAMRTLQRLAGELDPKDQILQLQKALNGEAVDERELPTARVMVVGMLRYLCRQRPGDTPILLDEILKVLEQ